MESIEDKLKKVEAGFSSSTTKAAELLKDKEKAGKTIDEAFEKAAKHKGKLEEIWDQLQLLFSIAGDYIKGNYKEIPTGSIVAIIGGLIYFLSPIDVIPDFIPVIGYLDDIFVIGLVINQVSADLKKYEEWKLSQK